MHEHKFTEEIVRSVLEGLEGQARPQWVGVRVGEVFHLESDSVQMHFELLTQGTPLQGVELRLEEVPLVVLCRECGQKGTVEDHHLPTCGSCGSLDVQVLQGNKVEIRLAETV